MWLRFEEAEGRRRAEEKRKQLAEERARRLAGKVQALKDLQALKDRMITLKDVSGVHRLVVDLMITWPPRPSPLTCRSISTDGVH